MLLAHHTKQRTKQGQYLMQQKRGQDKTKSPLELVAKMNPQSTLEIEQGIE
jgi:hypothetical protein